MHYKSLKNNVADFAKTPAFESEKLALALASVHGPTHLLVVCACTCMHTYNVHVRVLYTHELTYVYVGSP